MLFPYSGGVQDLEAAVQCQNNDLGLQARRFLKGQLSCQRVLPAFCIGTTRVLKNYSQAFLKAVTSYTWLFPKARCSLFQPRNVRLFVLLALRHLSWVPER